MGFSGGMISALGFMVGPPLGGFLTHALGWRSVFYVPAILAAVGFLAARFILIEEDKTRQRARREEPFDFTGTVTFALCLSSLSLALTTGQSELWHAPLVRGEFLAALASLVFFIWWEARARYPLLDLQLFRIRPFATGNVARLASFVTLSMSQLIMPFFLQLGLALDPFRAGLLMAASSLGLGVLSPVSGWLSDRIGSNLLSSAGLALMGVSFAALAFLQLGSAPFDIALRLGFLGIGLGLFQTPNNNSLMSSIPHERLGVASSFLSIVRSLGLSIGVALASAIVSARLVAVTGQTSLQNLKGAVSPEGNALFLSAFMQGYRYTYLTAGVLCFVGALVSSIRGSVRDKGAF